MLHAPSAMLFSFYLFTFIFYLRVAHITPHAAYRFFFPTPAAYNFISLTLD
jgi:hypothetical protein